MWTSARSYFQAAVEHVSGKLQATKGRLLKIPAVQLVVRTVQELGADDASHMAAGVAYYVILSLFPLLLGLIALFGLFLPAETIQEELFDFFERNLPGAIDVLEQNKIDAHTDKTLDDPLVAGGVIGGMLGQPFGAMGIGETIRESRNKSRNKILGQIDSDIEGLLGAAKPKKHKTPLRQCALRPRVSMDLALSTRCSRSRWVAHTAIRARPRRASAMR